MYLFQIAQIFFHFSQLQEKTVKNVFMNLTKKLETVNEMNWNVMSNIAFDFVKELNYSLGNGSRGLFTLSSISGDWIYLKSIQSFYEVLLDGQSKIQNAGKFMVLLSNLINFSDCPYNEELRRTLHELFTVTDLQLSLPDIGFMYNIKNHDILQTFIETNPNHWKHDSKYWFPLVSPHINDTFKDCFLHASKNQQYEDSIDSEFLFGKVIQQSPCLEAKQDKCKDYCKWHADVIQNGKKSDFLSLMKLTLPPRKIIQEATELGEITFLTRLFKDSKSIKNNSQPVKTSFASPMIFCYDRSIGFTGDEVGLTSKFCDDFFPTPTDSGICLTKNLDLKSVLRPNSQYESIFKPNLRKEPKNFKGNTLWSKMTLVLFPDVDNDFRQSIERSKKANLSEIEFQIHPSDELPNMIYDNEYDINLAPIELIAGKEYFIDVTPTGSKVSVDFESMASENRRCLGTRDNLPKSATFKTYSKSGCKYECRIKMAQDLCHCIPWDFVDRNSSKAECDVFGRSCFFNALRNLSQSHNDECRHCKGKCNFIQYHKTIKELKNRDDVTYDFWDYNEPCQQGVVNIMGKRELKDFLLDKDNILNEEQLKKVFNTFASQNKYCYDMIQQTRGQRLIVVHLRFLKPKVTLIDLKYSSLDKIANFGGKFGLFAQLTGCSLLAIFKIVFIMFKVIFSQSNDI